MTDNSEAYWWNEETDETTWDRPLEKAVDRDEVFEGGDADHTFEGGEVHEGGAGEEGTMFEEEEETLVESALENVVVQEEHYDEGVDVGNGGMVEERVVGEREEWREVKKEEQEVEPEVAGEEALEPALQMNDAEVAGDQVQEQEDQEDQEDQEEQAEDHKDHKDQQGNEDQNDQDDQDHGNEDDDHEDHENEADEDQEDQEDQEVFFSDEEEEDSDDDYESRDLDWTEGLSVISPDIDFHSIEVCCLLGCGAFSSVKLVRTPVKLDAKASQLLGVPVHEEGVKRRHGLIHENYEYFAMKMMTTSYIVDNGWENMVEQERLAMIEISKSTPFGNGNGDCDKKSSEDVQNGSTQLDAKDTRRFTLGLHQSFYDQYMIYLLIDFCSGGELFDYCQTKPNNCLASGEVVFYSACVVLGLTELHNINIVYRDLKLENLIIDRHGFIIVADFGLAKKTTRTYTVCGTPEYMSPELVLSTGHNRTADLWSLGILIFEMSCGATPFSGGTPMETYENIVQFNDHRCRDGTTSSSKDVLPWHITSNPIETTTKSIIHGLLQKSKRLRLGSRSGINEIKNHPFFETIRWNDMIDTRVNYSVPYVPEPFNVDDFKSQIKQLAEDVKLQHQGDGKSKHCYWKPEGFTKVMN